LADEASYIDIGLGAFDAFRPKSESSADRSTAFAGRAEFRYGRKFSYLGPAGGIVANRDGGWMAYGALYGEAKSGPIVVTPLAGVAAYHQGNSQDLGGVFQFRFSLSIAYQLEDRSRLGIQVARVTNAGISRSNPGDNELLLIYAIPTDAFR